MEVEEKDIQLRERNAQLQRQEAELQEKATLLTRLQRELQTLRVGDLSVGVRGQIGGQNLRSSWEAKFEPFLPRSLEESIRSLDKKLLRTPFVEN